MGSCLNWIYSKTKQNDCYQNNQPKLDQSSSKVQLNNLNSSGTNNQVKQQKFKDQFNPPFPQQRQRKFKPLKQLETSKQYSIKIQSQNLIADEKQNMNNLKLNDDKTSNQEKKYQTKITKTVVKNNIQTKNGDKFKYTQGELDNINLTETINKNKKIQILSDKVQSKSFNQPIEILLKQVQKQPISNLSKQSIEIPLKQFLKQPIEQNLIQPLRSPLQQYLKQAEENPLNVSSEKKLEQNKDNIEDKDKEDGIYTYQSGKAKQSIYESNLNASKKSQKKQQNFNNSKTKQISKQQQKEQRIKQEKLQLDKIKQSRLKQDKIKREQAKLEILTQKQNKDEVIIKIQGYKKSHSCQFQQQINNYHVQLCSCFDIKNKFERCSYYSCNANCVNRKYQKLGIKNQKYHNEQAVLQQLQVMKLLNNFIQDLIENDPIQDKNEFKKSVQLAVHQCLQNVHNRQKDQDQQISNLNNQQIIHICAQHIVEQILSYSQNQNQSFQAYLKRINDPAWLKDQSNQIKSSSQQQQIKKEKTQLINQDQHDQIFKGKPQTKQTKIKANQSRKKKESQNPIDKNKLPYCQCRINQCLDSKKCACKYKNQLCNKNCDCFGCLNKSYNINQQNLLQNRPKTKRIKFNTFIDINKFKMKRNFKKKQCILVDNNQKKNGQEDKLNGQDNDTFQYVPLQLLRHTQSKIIIEKDEISTDNHQKNL